MKSAEIARLLPAVFQQTAIPGTPLWALLEAMEILHAPAEAAVQNLDATLNPRQTHDRFVPYLAQWLDLDRFFDQRPARSADAERPPISTGLGRLRELIAAATELSRWRGTAKGLLLFLRTATGEQGFQIDESPADNAGNPRPFHIRVHAPESVEQHRPLIERIIELEKPAYVTYELEFGTP